MKKLLLLAVLGALIYTLILTDAAQLISLHALHAPRDAVTANPLQLGLWLFGVYVVVTVLTLQKTLEADDDRRPPHPNILACDDAVGSHLLTHMASHQVCHAFATPLFGRLNKLKTNYHAVPWATFSSAEMARDGLNETGARAQDMKGGATDDGIDNPGRAIIDSQTKGVIKAVICPGKDRILGVTIVGYHASKLIAERVLAVKHNLGLNKIPGNIHMFPTLNETNKFVAAEWKKTHATQGSLSRVERFLRFGRG